MTLLNQWPWAIGMILLAGGVLIINDWMQAKSDGKRPREQLRKSLGQCFYLLIGAIVFGGLILANERWVPDSANIGWLIPLEVVGVPLFVLLLVWLFAVRKLLWLYATRILTGRPLPYRMRKNTAGELRMKCPSCGCSVLVTPGNKGEQAFECPQCGEKATWGSEFREPS